MTVSDINAYGLVIGGSLVIILSYFANLLAKRTNIPSVLVLIGMGIAIREGLNAMGLNSIPFESLVLELLGTIGLIFIVLEAALELDLTREKMPLIIKSATMALLALLGSSAAIAAFLVTSMEMPLFEAWVYAIPLSIMSSAIIIPSVSGIDPNDREFMVYESTFSDIFGIMAFYLLLGNSAAESTNSIVLSIGSNLIITFILAVVVSYLLVYVLQKITSSVKLFLSIAVLLLIYSIQKLLHLSPLVLILIFGLMLNNHRLFFPNWSSTRKRLKFLPSPAKLLDDHRMHDLHRDYHLLTLENSFCHSNFLLRALRNDGLLNGAHRSPCDHRRTHYLLHSFRSSNFEPPYLSASATISFALHRTARPHYHPLVFPNTRFVFGVFPTPIRPRHFIGHHPGHQHHHDDRTRAKWHHPARDDPGT